MDCSLPGSSVHGISQARILQWVAFPSPGDLSDPGIEPVSPALEDRFFTTEPPGKPKLCLEVIYHNLFIQRFFPKSHLKCDLSSIIPEKHLFLLY